MNIYTDSDYLVTLIIITIIGFIISTAFYIYFVYLPASRIEDQFGIINIEANQVIKTVNDRISNIESETTETLLSVCETLQAVICNYNSSDFLGNCQSTIPLCPLSIKAYPLYCQQLIPFNPSCTCTTD